MKTDHAARMNERSSFFCNRVIGKQVNLPIVVFH